MRPATGKKSNKIQFAPLLCNFQFSLTSLPLIFIAPLNLKIAHLTVFTHINIYCHECGKSIDNNSVFPKSLMHKKCIARSIRIYQ